MHESKPVNRVQREAAAGTERLEPATGTGPSRRTDWLAIAGLCGIACLAWCAANGRWTAATWALPVAYPTITQDADKADLISEYAYMKAAVGGHAPLFGWKNIPELGAPHGANWNDFPTLDEVPFLIHATLCRFLGLFAGFSVSLLLGHVAAVVSFYVTARLMGCSVATGFVAGLAFGLSPYSFAQEPHHIQIAYIWPIPLFLLVWDWIASDEGIAVGSRHFWFAIAVAAVAGLHNIYYANILCQLTVLGALVVALRTWSSKPLVSALAVCGSCLAMLALNNVDTWTYKAVHGPNTGAFVREYKWLEIYGLKIVDLVIPPITHHFGVFARFAAAHRVGNPAQGVLPASPLQDEGSYLGIVGILALALLAATAVSVAVKGHADRIPRAAWQILWIVLCFTTGGLNAIAGAFGFTFFRTGCRYSVVILAIALMYAARRLTAWQESWRAKATPGTLEIATATAAVGICLLILWDQVPRAPTAEQMEAIARQVAADREFVAKMEAALPDNAMVFQLPVMEFPESPLPGIPSYDHFRPYLHSRSLRFSFGSMKGREREQWQQRVQQQLLAGAQVNQQAKRIQFDAANVGKAVAELRKLGFAAIAINRNGFPDRGKGLEEALLEAGCDAPPIRSAAGDLFCIPLRKQGESGS